MTRKLFAYWIIPIYTLLYACKDHLFYSNLSVISANDSTQIPFLIWTLMIGIYFYNTILSAAKCFHLQLMFLIKIIILIACISMYLMLVTPYIPEKIPIYGVLHVIFAFSSSVFLLSALLIMILNLLHLDYHRYLLFFYGILGIITGTLSLLSIFGIVSSFLEIFMISTCSIMAYRLYLYSIYYNEQ